MPSNVSIEYGNAEKQYHEAYSLEEKLIALQEMQSWEPKHKGAEKLRAELSKKIAKIKAQIEKASQRKGGGKGQEFQVRKEGSGQICVIGLPNSGKSLLFKTITGVKATVASFPFTTKVPQAGMMDYHSAKIQIVDVPAVVQGSSGGKYNGLQLLALIRNADALCLMLQAESAKEDRDTVIKELERSGIIVTRAQPKIEENDSFVYRKLLLIVNESEGKIPKKQLKDLEQKNEVIVFPDVSQYPLTEHKLTEFKEKLFWVLDKILVYTKRPGEAADMKDPLVLDKNATVESVAEKLHKDFARSLKFVKVTGSTKFAGQMVSRGYQLKNNDVVEVYS